MHDGNHRLNTIEGKSVRGGGGGCGGVMKCEIDHVLVRAMIMTEAGQRVQPNMNRFICPEIQRREPLLCCCFIPTVYTARHAEAQ